MLAPAMNVEMWENPATQRNAATLRADGVHLAGPAPGDQACGDKGGDNRGHDLAAEFHGKRQEPGCGSKHRQNSPCAGLDWPDLMASLRRDLDESRAIVRNSAERV